MCTEKKSLKICVLCTYFFAIISSFSIFAGFLKGFRFVQYWLFLLVISPFFLRSFCVVLSLFLQFDCVCYFLFLCTLFYPSSFFNTYFFLC